METKEELQIRQDDLRKKRNALYDAANEIQKEIDEIELKKYNVDQYQGKFIKIETPNTKKIIRVDFISRLYRYPKFQGPGIYVYNHVDYETNDFIYHPDMTIEPVSYETIDKEISLSSKEEYLELLNKEYKNMLLN